MKIGNYQQGSQTTAIATVLRGAGGFGKTTLALALRLFSLP